MTLNKTPVTPANRRQFLAGSVRCLALAGLGAYAVGQTLKARRLSGDPNCIKLYSCRECIEFSNCTLPKATRYRVSGS